MADPDADTVAAVRGAAAMYTDDSLRSAVFDQAENRRHAHKTLPLYVTGALPMRRRAKR